jgi:pimeloyl-ACP methyl ester carboxylesterase
MKEGTKKIIKITSLIAFLTLLIAAINKVIYLFSSLDNRLYNNNSNYYEWKFGKIHYTVTGTGKPVLLIHSQNNGASIYEFNKITKALSKTHTVYSIDLIGYGKSEKPKITYTAYLYVQLLSDFIQNIVHGNPDIITSGKSNTIATMLTLQYPDKIGKLIFINPTDLYELTKNPRTRDSIIKYILETPILGTFIYNIISSKSNIEKLYHKKYVYYNNSYLSKFISANFEASHIGESSNKFAYASNYCRYTNVNICNALKSLNHSVYLIQGSERIEDTNEVANCYKQVNASIESSTINNTKTLPHIENPNATIELLSIYLDS